MAVYITDESARAYWEAAKSLDETSKSFRADMADAIISQNALKGYNVPRSAIVDRKLHVLTNNAGKRRITKYVVPHVCVAALPAEAFRRLSPTIEIVSPEFLFVRMATKLPFWELVRLGFELCGTYVIKSDGLSDGSRQPLTSVKRIGRFLKEAGPIRGSRKAATALKYVMEKSNSPMETVLAMLLCLPCHYGGYGLPRPEMNHEIKLGKAQAAALGQQKFVCDFYWHFASYALEYYGREWHTGVDQVAYDAMRMGELQYRGIDITVVTYEQIQTPEDVQLLAKKVAKRLSVRLRKPTEACVEARRNLHKLLLAR